MKYLMIVISIIVITGCSRDIDGQELSRAISKCDDIGGVDYIHINADHRTQSFRYVRCDNGAIFMRDTFNPN